MSQYLSFSQAARMLGVSRHQLQAQVRKGELPCLDGRIAVEELRKRYPQLKTEEAGMIERMQEIKDTAFARRISTAHFPEPEIMARQIKSLRADLALERGKARKYQEIVDGLVRRFNEVLTRAELDTELSTELWRWLGEEMEKPHKPC